MTTLQITNKRCWLGLIVFFLLGRDGLLASGFTDITQPPGTIEVMLTDKTVALSSDKNGQWSGAGVTVAIQSGGAVSLKAPGVAVKKLHLHWAASFDAGALFLGDAWERAYGDLEWKPLLQAGAMPWYFLEYDGAATHGYGVMTGPAALCYWKVDAGGIDLWVRCALRWRGRGVGRAHLGGLHDHCTARQGKRKRLRFRARFLPADVPESAPGAPTGLRV